MVSCMAESAAPRLWRSACFYITYRPHSRHPAIAFIGILSHRGIMHQAPAGLPVPVRICDLMPITQQVHNLVSITSHSAIPI